jgi:anti-anti-sigma factor
MLTVTVEDHASAVVVRCRGRLVKGSETPLLCEAIHRYGQDISVDLSAVTAIDARGLGALISLQTAGVYVRLLNPSKPVRDLLELTTADTLFDIAEEVSTRGSDPRVASILVPRSICFSPAS